MNKKLIGGTLAIICAIGIFSFKNNDVESSDLSELNVEALAWTEYYDPYDRAGHYLEKTKGEKGVPAKACCKQRDWYDHCDSRMEYNCSNY